MERGAGILMPIFSLPNKSRYGTMGKEAYEFVDFLVNSGQKYWQVLPINDVDVYASPFSSTCINSGNPLFIDLKGYISLSEYRNLEENTSLSYQEYKKLKMKYLYDVYKSIDFSRQIREFISDNDWAIYYGEFMTLLEEYNELRLFPKELKNRESSECKKYLNKKKDRVYFYIFTQYLFFYQWFKLKGYANSKGIYIIGDSPCNSAMDSKEAWADSEMYLLDENLAPTLVAGVPPDYFSTTGQVWNTLIYNYDFIKENNYEYLLNKYKYLLNVYDYLKIDHFRGLEYYYTIPFGCEDGKVGEWIEGPGYPFIDLLKENGINNLILEDLGIISEGVVRLKEYSGYPGMKVYQFAFGEENSPFLPHNYDLNCIAYTGTHDNDTFPSFLEDEENRLKVCEYLNIDLSSDVETVIKESIKKLYESNSNVVIINPQDLLNEGNDYRFNTPGVIGGNWSYSSNKKLYDKSNIEFLKELVISSRRSKNEN